MTWNVLKALPHNKPLITHFAIAIVALVGCLGLISADNNPAQRALYDLSQRHTGRAEVNDSIILVAIDEDSKAKLGEWPWSNSFHAGLIDALGAAGSKTIGFTMPLQPASDPGDTTSQSADQLLEQAIKAHGRVALPLEISIRKAEEPLSRALNNLLARTQRHFGDGSLDNALQARPVGSANRLLSAAAGIGHVASPAMSDGTLRREYSAVALADFALPALSVTVANLAAPQRDAMIVTNEHLELNADLPIIPLRDDLSFNPVYPRGGFVTIPYWKILTGEFDKSLIKNKTVLVGFTEGANSDRVTTPVGSWPRIAMVAAATNSLLTGQTYHHPAWATALEVVLAIAVVMLCLFTHSRTNKHYIHLILLGSVLALIALDYLVLQSAHVTLRLIPEAAALMLYSLGLWLINKFAPPDLADSNAPSISMDTLKTLALTLHGQGQLDLAYETLRRCPPNEDTLDLLYRLAADYERRRDILKAAQVFRYVTECQQGYRDAAQKCRELQELIERPKSVSTAPPPSKIRNIGKAKPVAAAAPDASSGKESLGRYEIDRQIGKGAMGVVYLGRDPKINRIVAIKAIPLAEEFEDHDLVEARERFFREAEMAGRLNHPGIVTIFDAGEDHGLAYIAMEYIQGEHLSYYCEPSRLLPVKKALTLVIRVAEALNYAHLQNVVHRDIKPANIMFNIETDALKITDFGIARLSDVSRTKTGIVLGTPSFMSPEQLEGRPLDGRSDLFALGVTMYQLLTGQLPFRADSMTRLMNNIATEPHPPIRSLRPELPACLESIIDRSLAKATEDRFQNGVEMAEALRNCMRSMAA